MKLKISALKQVGLHNLEEHLPLLYRALLDSGGLESYLDAAAANTERDMHATIAAG